MLNLNILDTFSRIFSLWGIGGPEKTRNFWCVLMNTSCTHPWCTLWTVCYAALEGLVSNSVSSKVWAFVSIGIGTVGMVSLVDWSSTLAILRLVNASLTEGGLLVYLSLKLMVHFVNAIIIFNFCWQIASLIHPLLEIHHIIIGWFLLVRVNHHSFRKKKEKSH